MQIHNEPLFTAAPFYLLRAPVLSMNEYQTLWESESIHKHLLALFEQDAQIREAIFIASPKLYEALQNIGSKDTKQQQQIFSSFLRYLLRMTTRSTPFGLFSFVGLGHWGETVQNHFSCDRLHRRARPDMNWLLQVIDKIVENPAHFSQLPVFANPLVTYSAGRAYLHYPRKKETKEHNSAVSIRATPLVRSILQMALKPITMATLEDELLKEFPSLDLNRTRAVLQELLRCEILQVTLLPSLLTPSPYDAMLEKIKTTGIEATELFALNALSALFAKYSLASADETENLIFHIHNEANKIAASEHIIQVDLAISDLEVRLPKQLREELAEAVEFTWRLSASIQQGIPSLLDDYHRRFLEKYGTTRCVPLLELLSPRGLGMPTYQLRKYNPTRKQVIWKEWLQMELFSCLKNGQDEIILTQDLISRLFEEEPDMHTAPFSIDLFCQLIADSAEKIANGDYQFLLLGSNLEGGSAFGRFLDLIGPSAIQEMQEFYIREEKVDPKAGFVETSFIPNTSRIANVVIVPYLRKHCLDLSDPFQKGSLSLDQIYVSATEKRFCFSNQTGTTEWFFLASNVLRKDIAPAPIRFLREACADRYQSLQLGLWTDFGSAPFLPRITYKKIIISPAQWHITATNLDKNDLQESLKRWIDRWNLPRFVLLAEGDCHLLLDRQSSVYLKEILRRLEKGTRVCLIEKIGQQVEKGWLCSDKGPHLSELVVPLVKNPKYQKPNSNHVPSYKDSYDKIRWKVAGSEWLYTKLFISEESQDRFLLNHLQPLVEHCKAQGMLEKWFFIRYADPHFHIRLRFQTTKGVNPATLMSVIHDWAVPLLKEHYLQDFQIGTYEREVERYGGEELIEYSESFFCVDAETTLQLLHTVASTSSRIPIHVIAAISLVDLVKGLVEVKQGIPSYLASGLDKKELTGIRPWSKTLTSSNDKLGVQNAFRARQQVVQRLKQKMSEAIRKNALSSPLESIHDSLLHMHCNRLMGIDASLERRARLYAHYALKKELLLM